MRGKLRLAGELRREGFDCAVLLQNAFDAALLAWAARIPRRIGYSRDGRRALLTEAVAVPRAGEIPAHQRLLLSGAVAAGGIDGPVSPMPRNPAQRRGRGRRVGPRLVGAARTCPPGVGSVSAPAPLSEEPSAGCRSGLLNPLRGFRRSSSAASRSSARRRKPSCANRWRPGPGAGAHSLAGKTTLAEFIDLAATCSVYLTNDSGPMHVAAALGVPTVAIFGATDHVATGPTGDWARIVRAAGGLQPLPAARMPHRPPLHDGVASAAVVAEARTLLVAAGVVG